jgi:hypothetical protein
MRVPSGEISTWMMAYPPQEGGLHPAASRGPATPVPGLQLQMEHRSLHNQLSQFLTMCEYTVCARVCTRVRACEYMHTPPVVLFPWRFLANTVYYEILHSSSLPKNSEKSEELRPWAKTEKAWQLRSQQTCPRKSDSPSMLRLPPPGPHHCNKPPPMASQYQTGASNWPSPGYRQAEKSRENNICLSF